MTQTTTARPTTARTTSSRSGPARGPGEANGDSGAGGDAAKGGGGLKAKIANLRERHAWIDRLIRMQAHYTKARGNHLAGSITYFGFLSLFPLLAIAFAVLSYVVRFYPDARASLDSFLQANLPGLTGPGGLDVNQIANAGSARVSAGIAGIAGLLYSGLGWLDALREALRQMWAVEPSQGNIVVKKIKDVVILILLGTAVLVTTALSSIATQVAGKVLEAVGISSGPIATFFLSVLALVLAVLVNTILLTIVFARLPGHHMPWKNMLTGALLGAVAIEILKALATTIIGNTTKNPVYGAFAVIIALLIWFNFMARVVMYAAAWCVVGPVPTLEAKVAEEGETLDAGEAKAASEARERRGDDRDVPVSEPYKTTAGAVPVTTSGANHPPSGGPPRGGSGRSGDRDGTGSRGKKKAKTGAGGGGNGGFPSFAGVLALLAVRRKAAQRERETAGTR